MKNNVGASVWTSESGTKIAALHRGCAIITKFYAALAIIARQSERKRQSLAGRKRQSRWQLVKSQARQIENGMNRITAAIGRAEARITEKLQSGEVSQAKHDELLKNSDLALDEYAAFQNLKSLAFANGRITLDEANTIYQYLGETPEIFNDNKSLAVKSTLLRFYAELLNLQITGKL